MMIKVGDVVFLKGDREPWVVEFIRGNDEEGKSFKEYGLLNGDRKAIVRADRIKEAV